MKLFASILTLVLLSTVTFGFDATGPATEGTLRNIDGTIESTGSSVESAVQAVGSNVQALGNKVVNSGTGVDVRVSDYVGGVITTSEDVIHYETHQGHSFSLVSYVTITGNGTAYVLVTVPATGVFTHFVWSAESTQQARASINEDPVANGGTPLFTPNRNRNSVNAAGLKIYSAPTVTSTGTLLSAHNLTTGKNQGGASTGSEWVFRSGGSYLFVFENLVAQSCIMDYEFRWTEFSSL